MYQGTLSCHSLFTHLSWIWLPITTSDDLSCPFTSPICGHSCGSFSLPPILCWFCLLHTVHVSASQTLPRPSLSLILRGGAGCKEFAADRCIARRQTHAWPCAGQFPPECPKSHIPSIISSTEKTDGIINECSLIGGWRGCLPRRTPHSNMQTLEFAIPGLPCICSASFRALDSKRTAKLWAKC